MHPARNQLLVFDRHLICEPIQFIQDCKVLVSNFFPSIDLSDGFQSEGKSLNPTIALMMNHIDLDRVQARLLEVSQK